MRLFKLHRIPKPVLIALPILVFAALAAASMLFPTYQVGSNLSGPVGPDYPSTLPTPWVVGDGQILTPAGTQVYLGTTTRAKAVALNPTGNHTAAVLQMGAPQAVTNPYTAGWLYAKRMDQSGSICRTGRGNVWKRTTRCSERAWRLAD